MAQQMEVSHGVTIQENPHFKFIIDGRAPGGSRQWNVQQHGFALLDGHATGISMETFFSPIEAQQEHTAQQMFKFDGPTATIQSSNPHWIEVYYKEMAEAAKKILPGAEAAMVTYHVLRKSDLSFFGHSDYAVSPRIGDSKVHQTAARIMGGLGGVGFLPDQQFDALYEKLTNSTAEDFVRGLVADFRMAADTDLVTLLLEDHYYNFLPKAKEALQSAKDLRTLTIVPPKDPLSSVHQVASETLKGLQAISVMSKPLLRKAGSQLHMEGEVGIETYISGVVKAASQRPEREMSPEQEKELVSILRDDPHYDFVARSRRLIPKPKEGGDEKDEENTASFQPPAIGGGHCDVSAQGYLDQFKMNQHGLGAPVQGTKRRVVFLKFWRNVADTPIENHHLAMLDKRSIQDDDVCEGEINFGGFNIKQNRFKEDVDAAKLRWVYFPRMQRDEVLCFQQGDLTVHGGMDAPTFTFPEHVVDHATFHGAFEDPGAPANAAPRRSIEAGVFVFLPEEPETMSRL
jgi:hypothetical protein